MNETLSDGERVHNFKISIDDTLFLMGYIQHAPLAARNMQNAVMAGRMAFVAGCKGHVASETPISLGGMPGTEVVVRTKGQLIRARIYQSRTCTYILAAFRMLNRPTSPDIERYYQSFRLLK